MAKVVEQGDGWRRLDDGTVQVNKKLAQQLAGLAEAADQLAGDDDDEYTTVSGDDGEADESEFGATKKKKGNWFMSLFDKNKHKPKPSSNSNAGKTTNTTINLTGGGLPPQMANLKRHFESGSKTVEAAGEAEVSIRVQQDFHADSMVCNGSLAGASIKRIKFGPTTIYDVGSSSGADVSIFQANNPMAKEILAGAFVRGGLDIVVVADMPGAGDFKVTFTGMAPKLTC